MKRFEKTKGFILGVIVTLIIMTAIIPALAATIANIEVNLNSINIEVNGKKVASAGDTYRLDNGDEVPFSILYKGTTYLPIRKLGELLGKDIDYDPVTHSAIVNDKNNQVDIPQNNGINDYNGIRSIIHNNIEYLEIYTIMQYHNIPQYGLFNTQYDSFTFDPITREFFISNAVRGNKKETVTTIPENVFLNYEYSYYVTKDYYESILKSKMQEYEKLCEDFEMIDYADSVNEVQGFKLNGTAYYSMYSLSVLCRGVGLISNASYNANHLSYNIESFVNYENGNPINIPANSYYLADGMGNFTLIISVPENYIKHLGGSGGNPHIEKSYYESHVKPALRRYFNQWW